jgi:hypothetical protein
MYVPVLNYVSSCNRVLGKLEVAQLVRKFPTFYRTRRLIAVFTTAPVQSITKIHINTVNIYNFLLLLFVPLGESGYLSRCSDALRAGRPGFNYRQGKIFLFYTASSPALGPTQPHIQSERGAISPGAKRPGREADHSPPSSAEVKNGGAIPPLPHVLMA